MSKKEYVQLELPFDDAAVEAKVETVRKQPATLEHCEVSTSSMRLRAKRKRIRVTFGDGTVVCDVSATATMIMAIEKIGTERVAALNMESCHIPLVSRTVVDRYAEWTKPMADGWYLMAQGDTEQKYCQLKSVITSLSVDATVELGDFETISTKANSRKSETRKRKARLVVTMPDGMVICGDSPLHTYKQVVSHIGVEKVAKTNLMFGGNQIITTTKKYGNQVQIAESRWLTAPASVKDKYKILRILSSMTRTPFEVKILE